MDDDEEAIQAIGEWLMAEGVVGWVIDMPAPDQPVELQLSWENRIHDERIRKHFGDTLSITVLPEEAPRYGPTGKGTRQA